MQVAFGTPGHRGVTHLMAVGEDEYGTSGDVMAVVRVGGMVAGGMLLLGFLAGRPRMTGLGLGAVAALTAVHVAATRKHTVSASAG